MGINEILKNPTVKQVIFQITFPELFYIENKIGNIQERIMQDFPKSNLVYRKKLFSVNLGAGGDQSGESKPVIENIPPEKIWQFESNSGTKLNITTNSLDMSSISHKTYNSGEDNAKKFRYAIEQVLGVFIEEINLPTINRIGLRYIDHCPIIKKDNKTFGEWYNSKLPLKDFEIADVETMAFRAIVKMGGCNLGYVETIARVPPDGEYKLILDFDSFAVDIMASEYLTTTDKLHVLISDEYAKTIRGEEGPLYKLMKEGSER
jgi:uncharacterized protein (TIGR04255 family)